MIRIDLNDLPKSRGVDAPPCPFNVYGPVEWAIASTRSVLNLMVHRFSERVFEMVLFFKN